jgi:hypothetical protein
MPADLAITPRNLGSIRLDGYCPRCLKFLLLLRFHPPYDHFGAAIFRDAQTAQEAVLSYHFETGRGLPKEFAPFCDCVGRVDCDKHWSKFRHTHKSGVVLYGEPDEVLQRKDGSVCVIDHKTAHRKGSGKDKFFPQYETQVIGYGCIAEGLGLGKVTTGGLLYWEAQVDAVKEHPSVYYKSSTLSLPFRPSTVEVAIDYATLDPLLKELKAVWKARELPDGREGCDDCKKRELLLAIDEEFRLRDQATVRAYPDSPSMRRDAQQRLLNQTGDRMKLLAELGSAGEGIFSRDGVLANWEFLPLDAS